MKNYSDNIANKSDVQETAENNAKELKQLSAHMEPMCEAIESHDNEFVALKEKHKQDINNLWMALTVVSCLFTGMFGYILSM